MHTNNADLSKRFPELNDAERTLIQIGEAFVSVEHARAAFALMRSVVQRAGDHARLGETTVVTAPFDFDHVIMTISKWWFFNFHVAEADALAEGDDVEEFVPIDFETVLRQQAEEDDSDDTEDDEYEEEVVDLYQVGTFLLDSTIIAHQTLFEREDLEFYAYDFPEERIEAERFFWARMVWDPDDLSNEALLTSIYSAAEFLIAAHEGEHPFAEYHDADFELLVRDEALCERAIAAADFGDVIAQDGE